MIFNFYPFSKIRPYFAAPRECYLYVQMPFDDESKSSEGCIKTCIRLTFGPQGLKKRFSFIQLNADMRHR